MMQSIAHIINKVILYENYLFMICNYNSIVLLSNMTYTNKNYTLIGN